MFLAKDQFPQIKCLESQIKSKEFFPQISLQESYSSKMRSKMKPQGALILNDMGDRKLQIWKTM